MIQFNRISLSYLVSLWLFAVTSASAATLPDNLEWLTNDQDPVYASPDATKGGTCALYFPAT